MFKTLLNRLQLAWLTRRAVTLAVYARRERALHRMHMAQLRAEIDAVELRLANKRKAVL